MGKEMRQAILDGAQQIAVPAFVSTLCICIVFVPMFFLTGVAKFLFVPLAEAVSFAMLASLLPLANSDSDAGDVHHARPRTSRGSAEDRSSAAFSAASSASSREFRRGYEALLETTLEHRGVFVVCFLAFCVLSLGWFSFSGRTSSRRWTPD